MKTLKPSLIVCVLVVSLFPPWNFVHHYGAMHVVQPAGFGFLFMPPSAPNVSTGVQLAWDRLAIEYIVVIAALLLARIQVKHTPLPRVDDLHVS